MQRILLAEDDERLSALVKEYLEQNDFEVLVESDGDLVEDAINTEKIDCLILDIMLPGKDGLRICKDIRSTFSGPILMLTARDSDVDQVLGLEFGADDYVIKPADPRVLLARIRALLRRFGRSDHEGLATLSLGKLRVEMSSREAFFKNEPLLLTSHEFDLLAVFVRKSGQVLNREYLFKTVYGREYDGLDRTIDVRVSQLRKKLETDPDLPEKLKTVWGRGYLMVADAWE